MRILIAATYEDNFGDMLIRQCFEALLRSALCELDIAADIEIMPIKEIDEEKVRRTQCIFFAGGALFGISYESFFDYLERIMGIAQEENIPVVFSSIGFNNQNATPQGEARLRALLHQSCVRAISVRDDAELFKGYAEGSGLEVKQVCDPAVWAKSVCRPQNHEQAGVIGINVVRGGLFAANKQSWLFKDELEYLDALIKRIDESPYDYRLYTNGSVLDNNAMKYFARQYSIPEEKLIAVNSARELVNAINGFDFVAAIRMHSSIIAYALGIPAVNGVWNDKVVRFYKNIGRPQDAIELNSFNADTVFAAAQAGIERGRFEPDDEYLMSAYDFIFDSLRELTGKDAARRFDADDVRRCMAAEDIPLRDEPTDHMTKLKRAEKLYLDRFTDIKERDRELKKLTKKRDSLEKSKNELKSANAELKKELKRKTAALDKEQKLLDELRRRPLVRLDARLRRIFHKKA